jgi:hypothetical protein
VPARGCRASERSLRARDDHDVADPGSIARCMADSGVLRSVHLQLALTRLFRLDQLLARLLATSGQTSEASKLLEATAARIALGPVKFHYEVRFNCE